MNSHVDVHTHIHAGPLLYHFADMPGEPSIELSWQDIRRIAEEDIGFEIIVSKKSSWW